MGKRIIQQRRGRGTPRYISPSHRYPGEVNYRMYDDKEKNGVIHGKIINIIHSPGHSAPIMTVLYEDGKKFLMVAPEKIAINSEVTTGSKSELQIGNVLPLANVSEGTSVCCIESNPGSGPRFCRASGSFAIIVGKSPEHVSIKFPSNKIKILSPLCRATIGVVAGSGRPEKPFVKAGNRWHKMKARNKLYPKTSAVAMNATDHPFGSGRGRHKGKCSVPPRNAPPGRNVGLIRAKRTGMRR
ncbi:MAG: 50S ribosomal protein L2 [Nanoarchaeota archaeon]